MSIARSDQIDAASRETAGLRRTLSRAIGAGAPQAPIPEPLRPTVAAWERTHGEYGAACRHVDAPTPLLGILDQPGIVWCPRCFLNAYIEHVRRHPDRCDACHRRSSRFRDTAVQLNSITTVIGSVCTRCMPGPNGAPATVSEATP